MWNVRFWILPLFLTSLVVVTLFYKSQQNNPAAPEISQTLVEQEYPIDEVNDGVYTNYKYGFRFEYSNEFFSKQMPFSGTYQRWSSLSGEYAEDVILDASASEGKPGNKGIYDFWNDVSEILPGETALEGSVIKISNIDRDNVRGVYYFYKTPSTYETELSYGYVAEWHDGNITYYVSMTSGNKEKVLQNKSHFDQVVDSFEFLKHYENKEAGYVFLFPENFVVKPDLPSVGWGWEARIQDFTIEKANRGGIIHAQFDNEISEPSSTVYRRIITTLSGNTAYQFITLNDPDHPQGLGAVYTFIPDNEGNKVITIYTFIETILKNIQKGRDLQYLTEKDYIDILDNQLKSYHQIINTFQYY